MKFVPLVMESSGALGKHFQQLLKDLAIQAKDQLLMSEHEFLFRSRALLAFALQRGNSFLFTQFVSRCHVRSRSSLLSPALSFLSSLIA